MRVRLPVSDVLVVTRFTLTSLRRPRTLPKVSPSSFPPRMACPCGLNGPCPDTMVPGWLVQGVSGCLLKRAASSLSSGWPFSLSMTASAPPLRALQAKKNRDQEAHRAAQHAERVRREAEKKAEVLRRAQEPSRKKVLHPPPSPFASAVPITSVPATGVEATSRQLCSRVARMCCQRHCLRRQEVVAHPSYPVPPPTFFFRVAVRAA